MNSSRPADAGCVALELNKDVHNPKPAPQNHEGRNNEKYQKLGLF